jgi:epoxyqueuosine reductase QueG
MRLDLGEELRERLRAGEAGLVGFADLSPVPAEVRLGLPRAVSVAAALRAETIAGLAEGPHLEFLADYERLNALLTELALDAVAWLGERGYQATALATVVQPGQFDVPTLTSPLPHKTAATRAGLGWIGKCALLITEQYGPAVRLTTVLTDAPLPGGAPIEESRCGECVACLEACPGEAVSGKLWNAGRAREDFFDAYACRKSCREQCEPQGISETLCGRCIAACPWTRGRR